MDAWLKRTNDYRGATEVRLERRKPTPQEMANVTAHPQDSNGMTPKESVRATEDRPRDHEPAVGFWNPLKRRTKDNVGWTFGKRVCENMVLRGIFGPKRDEVTGG
jgi:hypothetical protein